MHLLVADFKGLQLRRLLILILEPNVVEIEQKCIFIHKYS